MEQLIVQVGDKVGHMVEFARSDGGQLKVGRGFSNDLVLSDPYVDSEQVIFLRVEDGWMVKAIDTTNPALLNGVAIDSTGSRVNHGDRVKVGRTQLRVYASDYVVEPTRQLVTSSLFGFGNSPRIFASLMLLFALVVVLFIAYQGLSTEVEWNTLFLQALYSGVGILFWAGSWALIGRLLRHQPNFSAQLGFTALLSGIITLVTPLGEYVEYAVNSLLVGELVTWLILLLTITVLFSANLMFATNLKHYIRVATTLAAAMLLISYATAKFAEDEFSEDPAYSAVLKPPFAHLSGRREAGLFLDAFKQEFAEVDRLAKEQ